ncbi:protein phosphatase 2C domain-containing protein [Dactylosporangium sp. CA-152071]|uniref:protein phosphatase 2C domain-containing protein n=1 Tax=Dactylosporangium sp. CA-152071 TaxID=3239933 RepID=UPI003D94F744
MQLATETCTEAAPGAVNEDAYRVGDGWAFVLDGAGRYPGHTGGCTHAITWVVERLATRLEAELAAAGPGQTLTAATAEAIQRTCADHGPGCDLTDPLSPGAALAVLRVAGDRVEWLVLADCAVVLEHPDRTYTVVIDDRVDQLRGAPIAEGAVRTYTPEFVRTVRNQPGGFWVASAVPAAADEALTGSVPREDVDRALLCSDGVSRLTERYGWTWADVFDLAENGLYGVIGAVRAAETSDPDPRRWRGKPHDDATAVWLTLANLTRDVCPRVNGCRSTRSVSVPGLGSAAS